jgi:hypothetical protein
MNAVEEGDTNPEAQGPGLFARYIQVFFSPDALFQELRARPVWVGAVLLSSGLVAAGVMLLPPDLMLATLRERSLASGQPLPQGFEDLEGVFRYITGAATFVFWPLILAMYAGVVTVIFAFLLGHEGTYKQYLAVVAHAHLITATAGVLVAPLRIVMEDAQLLISLGTFAPFLDDGYLFRFLSLVDLFGVWAWVLVGLGAARIARKKSWAVGCVFVLMIPVVTAAIGAFFTG